MPFRIDDDKPLKKYKTICNNIEDLKNIELNVLPIYDVKYIKTKIGGYGDTNFHCLNMPEDDAECESLSHLFVLILYYFTKQTLYASIFRQLCF